MAQSLKSMKNRSFFSMQSDSDRQTPVMLFEKWEIEQIKDPGKAVPLSCQMKLPRLSPFGDSTNIMTSSSLTPQMTHKVIITPNAPVKPKKQFKTKDLKPKKLQYTDEELKPSMNFDSGIASFNEDSYNVLPRKKHVVERKNFFADTQKCVDVQAKGKKKSSVKSTTNVQQTYIESHSNTDSLSKSNNRLSWQESLYRLQSSRDIGLWIQCCKKSCKKWRYTEDYHDPVDVPEVWYCNMNSDKTIASCNINEKPSEILKTLIENRYNAGSIVWARINGFPWWPAMVDDCPDSLTFFRIYNKAKKPHKYHIVFFYEKELQRAWVLTKDLKAFIQTKYSDIIKKTVYYGIDYKEDLEKAYATALSAVPLTILQRLQKFSFVAQYCKFYDTNGNLIKNNINTNDLSSNEVISDDEIPPSDSTKKHIPLKEFHKKIVSRRISRYNF